MFLLVYICKTADGQEPSASSPLLNIIPAVTRATDSAAEVGNVLIADVASFLQPAYIELKQQSKTWS